MQLYDKTSQKFTKNEVLQKRDERSRDTEASEKFTKGEVSRFSCDTGASEKSSITEVSHTSEASESIHRIVQYQKLQ